MRRRFTLFLFLPAVALMPFLVVVFGACSSQGEGERCSPEAGNAGADDCQSGLECAAINNVYRCCPHDRSTATTAACAVTGVSDANSSVPEAAASEASSDATSVRADGAIEADTQSSDAAPPAADVAAEALSDGTAEALSEAMADVSVDSAADGRASTDAAADASDGSDGTTD